MYGHNQNELDHHLDDFGNDPNHYTPPPPTWIDPDDYIQYDRRQRHYEVANGDGEIVETFPSGTANKRKALRFTIELFSPQLADLAKKVSQKHPQLESCAWKACRVVMSGKIQFINTGNVIATVDGSSPDGAYTVTDKHGVMLCTCLHFREGGIIVQNDKRFIRQFCKHGLAVSFCQELYKLA